MSYYRFFNKADIQNSNKWMIFNTNFSKSFPYSNKLPIVRKVLVGDHEYELIDTLDLSLEGPRALIPITLFDESGDAFPAITMKFYHFENIPSIKEEMSLW